jgi:hypothetical protein
MKHNRHGEMTWCQYPDLRERSFVYDDASIYQQSKGNMLMCQETAKGSTRTTTFLFDQRFNLVNQQSYWDGLSLRIPSYLRTNFYYDTQGNLSDISGPRTLFAVLIRTLPVETSCSGCMTSTATT